MKKLGMGRKKQKIMEFLPNYTGSALLKTDPKASKKTRNAIKQVLKEKEVVQMGSIKQTMGILFTIVAFAFGTGVYLQKMQSGIENQGVILNKIANGMEKRTEKVHSLALKVVENAGEIKNNSTRLKLAGN